MHHTGYDAVDMHSCQRILERIETTGTSHFIDTPHTDLLGLIVLLIFSCIPTSQFQPLRSSIMGHQGQGYELDTHCNQMVAKDAGDGQSKPWWGAGREGMTVENTARINV